MLSVVLHNPFWANIPILYALKTPENLCFFPVFKVYKMGTLVRNGLSSATSRQHVFWKMMRI